jgi:hypothetical protein
MGKRMNDYRKVWVSEWISEKWSVLQCGDNNNNNNNNSNNNLLQMGCHPVAVITFHLFPNTVTKFT